MDYIKLKKLYNKQKPLIVKKLNEFRNIYRGKNLNRIFEELCYCILTANWKAKESIEIQKEIRDGFEKWSKTKLKKYLKNKGHRFWPQRAEYIVKARKYKKFLREIIKLPYQEVREWLTKNIKGIGYKEASHFLRNIGLGENIAILDRHILKNLKKYGIIKEVPKSLSSRKYIEIENKMKLFSKKIKIPISHLDLLFWSKETGEILK
ncbi:MAG: N-glycosylase/DNA lyase [Endomicrobiia bacterium]